MFGWNKLGTNIAAGTGTRLRVVKIWRSGIGSFIPRLAIAVTAGIVAQKRARDRRNSLMFLTTRLMVSWVIRIFDSEKNAAKNTITPISSDDC